MAVRGDGDDQDVALVARFAVLGAFLAFVARLLAFVAALAFGAGFVAAFGFAAPSTVQKRQPLQATPPMTAVPAADGLVYCLPPTR